MNLKSKSFIESGYKLMKLTFYQIIVIIIFSSAVYAEDSFAQNVLNKTLTLEIENKTLHNVITTLEKEVGVKFVYSNDFIELDKLINYKAVNQKLSLILKEIFEPLNLGYEIIGGQILLKRELFETKRLDALPDYKERNQIKETGNVLVLDALTQADHTVTGTVTSEEGGPLPGVSVVLKGTVSGTTTDSEGKYSISLPSSDGILIYSYIGFVSEEVSINNRTVINVSLNEDIASLKEVVVVGYGSQKKRDIIGSVSGVKGEDLNLKSSPSFESALQGMAAGVSVQSQSGVPGAPTKIRIRGIGSIMSGTDPLYIIDGMPVYNSSAGLGRSDGTTNQSPMALINPNDIADIQVLKDAAATSIYGSRGSNGVIIITTKSGKKGQGATTFNYSSGFSDLTRTPEDVGYADTQEWFKIMDEAYENSGKTFTMQEYYSRSPNAFDILSREQAMSINTNWFKELFQVGSFSDYNLSSSGGFEKGSFYVSANYREDKGVQVNNNLKRISARSNVDFNPTKNLTVGAKLNFSYTKNNRKQNSSYRGGSGANGGLNSITTSALPWLPVFDPSNSNRYHNAYSGSNPAAFADNNNLRDDLEQYRGLGGVFLNYNFPFLKGLSLRTELSGDVIQSSNIYWRSRDVNLNSSRNPSSRAVEEAITFSSINYNAYTTYDKLFGEHNLNFVLGVEAQRSRQYNRYLSGENLTGKYQELGRPGNMLEMNTGLNGERYLLGYFGRLNYKFKDKYLVGLSTRRDGSTAFTEGYRWGTFIAASAGWIVSNESFMNFLGRATFLKIRGSYGETGNQSIPGNLNVINYNNTFRYGGTEVFGVNGTMPSTIANEVLTWESTRSTDLGIDYGLFNNRINGSIAYYSRFVKDMLLGSPLPASAGVTPIGDGYPGLVYNTSSNSIMSNIGDMVNTGLELEIHTINIDLNGFKWSTDFNIAFNNNLIKKLTPSADKTGKGIIDGSTVSRTGHKRREWFVADYAGVDKATGIPMIYALDKKMYDSLGVTDRLKKENGEDSLTYATKTNIASNRFYTGKSADPKYYGGITNTFQYKGVDLSLMFTFSGGNYILDYDRQMSAVPNPTNTFLKEVIDNVWRKPGDQAKYPQLVANNTYVINGQSSSDFGDEWPIHDREMYRGDFIRLRNIQLGYTFPKSIVQNIKMQNLRVYVSGTNLWTNTDYPGFDPEGAEYVYSASIPQLKSLIFGLDVKF